jgi:CO/xanthine dehydrogenase FAD-binding subunit
MSSALTTAIDVLQPSSREEAIAAFGDGSGVLVVGGGTIVVPALAAGKLQARRALLLANAGLEQLDERHGTLTIGATVPVAALAAAPEPLASAAAQVGDFEVRAQATVGGNLCAPALAEYPRGDLQAALLALDAQVTSAGAGGERTEGVEEFLTADPGSRLVLSIEVQTGGRGVYVPLDRPHTHGYTALAVAAARRDGALRVAVTGVGDTAVRLRGVEESGDADRATEGIDFRDDALASAWYRRRMLPVLMRRALERLEEPA